MDANNLEGEIIGRIVSKFNLKEQKDAVISRVWLTSDNLPSLADIGQEVKSILEAEFLVKARITTEKDVCIIRLYKPGLYLSVTITFGDVDERTIILSVNK
jgi:hypothetical protein